MTPSRSRASFSFEHAQAITGGNLMLPSAMEAQQSFHGLSIDSRSVEPGQAFVAIVGEHLDGHTYVAQAIAAGAALVICDRALDLPRTACLRVADTSAALNMLAQAWRRQINPFLVALTGSVGKTTTKELLRNIFQQEGPTHATPGNFNNHIGVPLTLLAMPEETRYAIVELGMNAPGEIAALSRLAEPQLGLITAIAPVHLEGLGSVEAVAAAKAELLAQLGHEATAVIPCDALLAPHLGRCRAALLRFGSDPAADIELLSYRPLAAGGSELSVRTPRGTLTMHSALFGRHNALNALAATAVAEAAGLGQQAIRDGLCVTPALDHRSQLRTVGEYHVVDDCYNANPLAVEAALAALVELAGPKPVVAVLGEMRELGEQGPALHRALGQKVANLPNLALLVTAGSLASEIAAGAQEGGLAADKVCTVQTPQAAGRKALEQSPAGSWLLFKGSRGARMEVALEEFCAAHKEAENPEENIETAEPREDN